MAIVHRPIVCLVMAVGSLSNIGHVAMWRRAAAALDGIPLACVGVRIARPNTDDQTRRVLTADRMAHDSVGAILRRRGLADGRLDAVLRKDVPKPGSRQQDLAPLKRELAARKFRLAQGPRAAVNVAQYPPHCKPTRPGAEGTGALARAAVDGPADLSTHGFHALPLALVVFKAMACCHHISHSWQGQHHHAVTHPRKGRLAPLMVDQDDSATATRH
mmetsp:Transcript_1369/g.2890  ORF Transcript_1369/g.2890 Transcript_1369/m.2890 type:complete len:217 (+) Transcript_1369:1248-1898(+)